MVTLYKISFKKIVSMALVSTMTAILIGGCYNDKEEILYPGSNTAADCSTVPSAFSTDIYPLINSKCAISGCHDATASGGVVLQNYNQVNSKKDRINVRALIEKSMPPTGPLLPAEINKIKCWIDGGALNN
jgi:hypothetical protein